MRVRGKHVILSFVLLVTGFILALSYDTTSERNMSLIPGYERQWDLEDELRNQVIMEQTANRNLQEELRLYQAQVRELENNLASMDEEQEVKAQNLLEDIERLRKLVGQVKVQGPGIEISLEDAEYVPDGENPNNYIVHEFHIQRVVHELFVAGAEAIAINGFRLSHQSYIQCTGPVIRVDGNTSSAPFVITAIGDADHLESAITLTGGVQQQLLNDEISVRLQKKNSITLDPHLVERG
ncbi:DUF881 domain-containing protein [Halalkalibacter akibai]|uniref:Division initiation protein n=1 Tax=Halalkalibacter akibai (strain ATCC 43226 / DSM 21942 / CIP 109018 / JCM 9157 / 1139) TaxID=1236973 RepID=W4QP19_HALA3|nr:DUF881 domain-containing protein [Halalkalibacter akibai]GAE33860.1 division initiation protein [Halalkalibacter akibai JCM 9157]